MPSFVVNADNTTVPVALASGYASCSQLCSNGNAHLMPKATRISAPPGEARPMKSKASEPLSA